MQVETLELQSEKNRKRLVEIVYKAKAGHIGGDLSCLNVLTALYFDIMRVWPDKPKEPKRDRFVMSKGHCVEALYVTLEAKGFISRDVTDTLGEFGSILSGHPTIEVPGIEVNSGALGHGLSIGVGMALAAKMDEADYKTYVLMGDGEQGEGSIYEAAMAGNQYKLDNLVAIIDRNRLQISGTTEEVMSLESMRDRWTAFGWDVLEMNGDEMEDIIRISILLIIRIKSLICLSPIQQKEKEYLIWKASRSGIMACLQPNNMKRLFVRYPKELKN